jgi:predicted component of type VI protein secretion system
MEKVPSLLHSNFVPSCLYCLLFPGNASEGICCDVDSRWGSHQVESRFLNTLSSRLCACFIRFPRHARYRSGMRKSQDEDGIF